jgi:hypothetical protein
MKKMLRQVKYAGDEALRAGKLDEAIRHYSFCITAASRGGFIKSSRVVVLLGQPQHAILRTQPSTVQPFAAMLTSTTP